MIVPKQAGNLAYLADSLPRLRRARHDRAHRAASRTPEGHYGRCPVCREFVCVEFSHPAGDALCPSCGQLHWEQELGWPFRVDEPGPSLRERRPTRARALASTLGRLIGRAAARLRRKRRREPIPVPAPPSASTMYDPWLDG